MSDTVRTKQQLQTLFADNSSGLITAQDGRDEIVSSFGYLAITNPTANNDKADTAGIGAFFDAGSKWVNTSTLHLWQCYDGTAGAAVWRELANFLDIPAPGVVYVGLTAPSEISVAGSPITSSGTFALSWSNEPINTVFAGPSSGAPGTPSFRSLVTADLPTTGVTPGTYGDATHVAQFTVDAQGTLTAAGNVSISASGTVTSVALTMPAQFSVAGSPITTSGTLAISWANESANLILAGPTSGGSSTPSFRALVNADLPVTGITAGTYGDSTHVAQFTVNAQGVLTAAAPVLINFPSWVSSVGLSAPAEFSVSGSPVTSSGTLALSWANQSANMMFAGPGSGGATTPGFRALVPGDIPGLPTTAITSGVFLAAFLPASTVYQQGSHGSGTSTAGAATIISFSDGNGIIAIWNVKNTGLTNTLKYTITATDWLGNSGTSSGTIGPNTSGPGFNVNAIGTVGLATAPFVTYSVSVQDNTPGSHTNYSYTSSGI